MLNELFPQTHKRYSSLPLLGSIADDFAGWLLPVLPTSLLDIGDVIRRTPILSRCRVYSMDTYRR